MSLVSLQLNNFTEIYNRLHKIYLPNKNIINIRKYFDSDTGRVALYFEFKNKAYNKWFNFDISQFTELSTSYEIYDNVRNTINFTLYKMSKI